MTQPLSPAAQAVLKAADDTWLDVDDDIPAQVAAAALRALADRLQIKEPLGETDADAGVCAAHHAIRAEIRAIAAELEGDQ